VSHGDFINADTAHIGTPAVGQHQQRSQGYSTSAHLLEQRIGQVAITRELDHPSQPQPCRNHHGQPHPRKHFASFHAYFIGLNMYQVQLSLLDEPRMHSLTMHSCSISPLGYGSFIQSLGMNNRLDRASIREQDHHDHDQCRWPAQPFHHRASSCTKCLLTRVTTRALGLIRMNTNVARSSFASCGTRLIRATLF